MFINKFLVKDYFFFTSYYIYMYTVKLKWYVTDEEGITSKETTLQSDTGFEMKDKSKSFQNDKK